MAQLVKSLPVMQEPQETRVPSLDLDPGSFLGGGHGSHGIRHPTEHKGREDSSLNCLCSITHPHEQRVYQEILPGGLNWPLESLHSTNARQKVS